MPFKLESYEFGSNDFCSHYFYNANYIEPYKSLSKTYKIGETDSQTGDVYCVYCNEMIDTGSCKHKEFYVVNNMGIGNGDKICKDCDKVLEYDCIYYQYKYSSIPSGGFVSSQSLQNVYKIYTAKDGFPETMKPGDRFEFGDFQYCYGADADSNDTAPHWSKADEGVEYWGVSIIDRNKQYYSGEILSEINGKAVKNMMYCFYKSNVIDASNLIIPNSITHMSWAFDYCENLESAPGIPSSVTNAYCIFYGCERLSGDVRIDSTKLKNYKSFFYGTRNPIKIIGNTNKKAELAATANNGNVTY